MDGWSSVKVDLNFDDTWNALHYVNVYGGIWHLRASEFRRGVKTDEHKLLQQQPARGELVLRSQYNPYSAAVSPSCSWRS
jgi:hypothetical protein